ncbi:MAG: hypothetical protein WA747_10190 [Steroidobacteraceae bacterium]
MEVLLLLWDELDDLTHACRHVATSAAVEALARAAPIVTAASAALLAGTASFWGMYRQLLRLVA